MYLTLWVSLPVLAPPFPPSSLPSVPCASFHDQLHVLLACRFLCYPLWLSVVLLFVFHQFFAPYLTNSLHYLLPMIYTHTQIIFSGVLIGWSMNHSDQLFHDTCRDIQPLAQIPFCWVRPAPPHPPNAHYYICCFLSTAACSGHCCLDQIS